MADARFTFTISRPLEEVFAVLTDPEKTPKWSAPAVEEHWITPGPPTIGSRRLAVTQLMGRSGRPCLGWRLSDDSPRMWRHSDAQLVDIIRALWW